MGSALDEKDIFECCDVAYARPFGGSGGGELSDAFALDASQCHPRRRDPLGAESRQHSLSL